MVIAPFKTVVAPSGIEEDLTIAPFRIKEDLTVAPSGIKALVGSVKV